MEVHELDYWFIFLFSLFDSAFEIQTLESPRYSHIYLLETVLILCNNRNG